MNATEYRTESGHAPGEVTPDGIGVLHGRATKHKTRMHFDGTYHYGARHHFDKVHLEKLERSFMHGWQHVLQQHQKSKSNSAESDMLLLEFNNTNWANVGDATGLRGSSTAGSFYIGLCTADPGETGDQTTNETAFTNYARQAVARSSGGWTISGTAPTQAANAAAITFPQCGATGATLTYFIIGRASASTGEIMYSGALTSSLIVNNGITPSFAIGALLATED